MTLRDLLNNPEFNFNVAYRVVKYTPTDEDPDHVDVLYDSGKQMDEPAGMLDMWIEAINQDSSTGIVDLECYSL